MIRCVIKPSVAFISIKATEIIEKQIPIDAERLNRIKEGLAKHGMVIEQSAEWDERLISKGYEALTFSDGTIVAHTKASASGIFEELIHYGQIKRGGTIIDDEKNNILMEIEAKERLIKYKKAYRITESEIETLTDGLEYYKIKLKGILRGSTDVSNDN